MPAFDSSGVEIVRPRVEDLEHLCEIGGEFERGTFYIEFFHDCLRHEDISASLGLIPTQAWNAGEPHFLGNGSSGSTRVDTYGKWVLKVAVEAGTVSSALQEFFQQSSVHLKTWRELSERWGGRVALVGYANNWNREFSLSADVVAAIAARGLGLNFDAYFTQAESDDVAAARPLSS